MNIKITLTTASSDSFWYIFRHTVPNKVEYCLRWGIQFDMRKLSVGFHWTERIKIILKMLDDCDWLWFMGGDTLIMNQTIDVKRFINPAFDFIIGKDINGINNDVCFFKNSEGSRKFLNKILSDYSTYQDDQEPMKVIIGSNPPMLPDFKYCIVPQKFFNSYLYDSEPAYDMYPKSYAGNFKHGDFILHFPGIDNYRREELIQKYIREVIK